MIKKLFLLDAMALIYRAYYAMIRSPRLTSKGLNTSAIFGFCTTLHEVLKTEKPTHIAVSFDTGSPTLRHVDFADYKANRQATPEDIIMSVPYIKRLLEAFHISIVEKVGYEADDVIGTLAKHAEIEGFEVYMMTSDKDYGQLVSDHIHLYKPGKFGQKAEVVGVAQVCEKYGIQNPEQLIDILGLGGDSSDNIPGVPNIGEVKAKKLIVQFGSIEQIYQRITEVENVKLRQTLIDNQEQAIMSKMLATIILDVPVSYNFDDMAYTTPDVAQLQTLFAELEFKALGARIFADLELKSATAPTAQPAVAAPDLFSDLSAENQYAPTIVSRRKSYNDSEHHYQKAGVDDLEKSVSQLFNNDSLLALEPIFHKEELIGIMVGNAEKAYYALNSENNEAFLCFSEKILKNSSILLTYQCKAIHKWIRRQGLTAKAQFYDLQIAHYLIQPENWHNLDRLCENYLDYSLMKEELAISVEAKLQQACERIDIYHQLYPILDQKLDETGAKKLFYEMEMPLAEILANMEYEGVFIDKTVLQESSVILTEEMYKIEKQIFTLSGERFNLASPKQLGDILFGKLRIIENAKLTKSKQYQTGEEVLAKLVQKHPIVPLILEWRTLAKLKSTYLDALPQLINLQTKRVHTTYTQTVTSTGRLSSLNPNLQNIPIRTERGREIRKAFTAPDALHVIMAADYSQIELRIVASV
ncbi:MAG: DNA polymerase I, partial [Bacteroidales bacterium]|nr:DNA polymerase I [Bacteroidales bacterium]